METHEDPVLSPNHASHTRDWGEAYKEGPMNPEIIILRK